MDHKYQPGSLLIANNGDFGYIQDNTDESFYGEPVYSVFWFKDGLVCTGMNEISVAQFIRNYKEKYGQT